MRISLISARFPPDRCGVGDYTYFLADVLARIGHEVDVVTSVGGMDSLLYPLSANLRVHRVISSWAVARLPEVVRELRKLDPDVLLIQYTPHSFDRRGVTLAINVLPALSRVGTKARIVTNFHEVHIPFAGSTKQRLNALWQRITAGLLASGSHGLSVTVPEWDSCLRRLGIRGPIACIPVGSNIPRVPVSEDVYAELRGRMLGSSTGILVAGFGAQHDRDIPDALSALKQLKKQQRAKLIWIGGGDAPEQHRLRIAEAMRANGLREEDVEWTGILPHPMVSRLLGVCDLVLLPFVDGISTRRTSAVTALQHGLPLLTTRGNRVEPWFAHGENVYLVPRGDRKALSDGLIELCGNRELRVRLGQGARSVYEAHFSWEIIAKQVIPLLDGAPNLGRNARSTTEDHVA